MKRLLAGALAAVSLGTLAGCGSDAPATMMGKDEITVGVRTDLPGIGFRPTPSTFDGFDVDVARYIAGKIGVTPRFVPILAADREKVLVNGTADMVLATFSISQDRKSRVLFAGPYHLSYQDILVRADETRIKNVRDLAGRKICEVKGSNAGQRVVEERNVAAQLVPLPDYGTCMQRLKSGDVDAITTNDVILAGLAARDGSGLHLVNAQFNEQRSGVGLRHGDVEGCEAVNRAITDMYQDGTAKKLLKKWFGSTDLNLSAIAVPQFEGCS
ncbi:glutamate ABC transporter substrate-binding protein [Nonomuraea sp. NBC_01738]|uniref:glutamate ABC transporter substrate-binding protein n=1 Tax=Nonomuraea sp. NBC_01738 TaxID=2976003 RepID=UPI002E0FE14E|nr:glutamate ABC transporter substrate-binding protein [Nonomuraea sp. NBC_01738]